MTLGRNRRFNWEWIVGLLLTIAPTLSFADAPLGPPRIHDLCNATGSHCASSDPVTNRASLTEKSSGVVLWSVDRYFRFFHISNDGRAMLAQTDFANLVPLDATKERELFRIYRNGKLIQTVRLEVFFGGMFELRRTVSHFAWGYFENIDENDNAIFELVDGRKVSYSLVTGLLV